MAGVVVAVKTQMITLFLSAIALTTALAWNAAVQSYFKENFKTDTSTTRGQFFYALTVTMVAVAVAYLLLRFGRVDPSHKLF